MALKIAVIGAGIVGASTALELVESGHDVTLIEPGSPGGEQAASYGNGAWLSPSSVVPMSMPGLWRKVPGYLLDPTGPLTIRWTHLPRLLPWLIRFLMAGSTVAKVERTAHLLSGLVSDAPQRHAALAEKIGRPDLIRQTGLLYAYPNRAAFESEALAWRLRRNTGVHWTELDAEALAAREPALNKNYGFGVFMEKGAHCFDPGAFVAAIVDHACSKGVKLARTKATGFEIENGRLLAVLTQNGSITCERAVIAAGIASKTLAKAAGDRVFMESERGYHVVVPSPSVLLRTPIMPSDGKQANTSTASGLRASGQVELCAEEVPPNWNRAEILLDHLSRTYPGLSIERGAVRRWMGHRPSTCDGIPVIGPSSRTSDILYAFGHGHAGLAAGPKTAEIVRQMIDGKTSSGEAPFGNDAFGAARFSRPFLNARKGDHSNPI